MTFFKSLTKKLVAISLILLLFLTISIFSIFTFTKHMRNEALRINVASQLRVHSSEMAWHAQRIVEREFEILDPVQRESHLAELKKGISAFDHMVQELKEGSKEKGLSPMEYAEALPMLNTIIEKWNNHQKPVLVNLIGLPVDVPEKKARELLHMYDAGVHESVHEVDKLVSFLEKDYRTEIEEFDRFMLYMLGFFSVAAVFIVFYARHFIVKPIKRLRDSAQEIQSGNFTVTVDAKTSDELGELSQSFNIMTTRLTEIFNEAEKRANDILAMNIASNSIIGIPDLDRLYKTICESVLKIYDLKLVWLGLIEEGTFVVKPVAQAGERDDYLSNIKVTWDEMPTGKGPTGMAIKKRFPQMIPCVDTEPSYVPWIEQAGNRGFKSVMAAPLICLGDEVIGVINLYSDKQGYFTPEMIELMQIFANQAAAAIDNARMIAGLEKAIKERTWQLEDAKLLAESANLSKSNFLANMSHELRTPLNVIIGFSEALVSGIYGEIKGEHAEYIKHILQSGTHLLSLINSIIEITKADTGTMVLDYSECSIKDIICNSVGMFKEKAKNHSISLHVEIEEGLMTFLVDDRKIKYVIVNLLTNALKNTADGGKICVSAGKAQDLRFAREKYRGKPEVQTPLASGKADEFIVIAIDDTGPAIPEEEQKSLFTPFYETESPLSGVREGMRIGLALCKRFIELHGGSIRVESRPAVGLHTPAIGACECEGEPGNRFVFVLPQRPSDDKLLYDSRNYS